MFRLLSVANGVPCFGRGVSRETPRANGCECEWQASFRPRVCCGQRARLRVTGFGPAAGASVSSGARDYVDSPIGVSIARFRKIASVGPLRETTGSQAWCHPTRHQPVSSAAGSISLYSATTPLHAFKPFTQRRPPHLTPVALVIGVEAHGLRIGPGVHYRFGRSADGSRPQSPAVVGGRQSV